MGKFQQYYTAIAGSFGSLVMGILNTWPSYTLGLLTSENTTILSSPMTEFQSSMFGSLPSLGAMIGTAIVGLIINTLGRPKGGVVLSLPFVISWAVIGQTTSATVMLVMRFISGIGGGAFLVFGPMYISEVAEDSIRGTLASGPVAFYCIGSLMSYFCGWFLNYRLILWICLAISVLCCMICFFAVESPLYLLRNHRDEDAKRAIAKYKGECITSKVVLKEMSRLKAQISPPVELVSITDDSKLQKADKADEKPEPEKEKLYDESETIADQEQQKMSTLKLLFYSTSSRRALLVVATVLTLQVFMGIVPVMVYAKTLFAQAAPNLSSHFCSVLFALMMVCGSTGTGLVADKAGRRILLIGSSVFVALTMAILGFLIQTALLPSWVTAVTILVYCLAFNLGAGTVPYVLLAEVFVPEVQGLASMLLVEWVWLLNFFIIGVFPFMKKLLGIHIVFYIFAAVGLMNAVIGFKIVPETKGLTNEQIQEAFRKRL